MSGRRYFIVGIVSMVILGAWDLINTWMLTPDLKYEGNTFVTQYGFGWVGIILAGIAFIIFVTIPFYYHSLVFNYPDYNYKNPSPYKYINEVLFRNHKNPYISIGKFLFNGLGFYLFWKYVIIKITAIVHNILIMFGIHFFGFPGYPEVDKGMAYRYSGTWFYNIVRYYWEIPSRRIDIMNWVETVFLIIMMLLFIGSILYKEKKKIKRKYNSNSVHISWVIGFFLLYISFKIFTAFPRRPQTIEQNYSVKLTDQIDPDIILINIQEGDRAFIGKLLLSIDSCKPALIAIDAFFTYEKDKTQDSILINGLKAVKNDILAYGLDSAGQPYTSQEKFRSLVVDEGLLAKEYIDGLAINITPIRVIDNKIQELFALKIIKLWKPQFKHKIKINKSIPIMFTRTLEQFIHFDGSELKTNNHCKYLRNKVVLLGYLGPSNEDKHYTPIRLVKNYPINQSDTYGLVIVANEIRTILEYEKRD